MEVFNKKETLIRTICFMAFFVAINVICSFAAIYAPVVSVVLIIFLPLTSAVVEISCKDRWFPIYALATIGLSIVVSLSQIDFTIFYVVPSIFTGYIFGLSMKKNLPDMFAIFFASVIQTGLSFAFIPLLNLISGTNLFDFIAKIFRISSRFWFDTWIILVFFLVALIQTILSYIVVKNELKKLGAKTVEKDNTIFANFAALISVAVGVVFTIFYLPLAYLLVGISFFFATYIVIFQVKNKKYFMLILDGVFCLLTVFIYAFLNIYLKEGRDFSLFMSVPFMISVASIFHYFLKKSKE